MAYPRSASLGLMIAVYSLGSVAAILFAPFVQVVDEIGRRYSQLSYFFRTPDKPFSLITHRFFDFPSSISHP